MDIFLQNFTCNDARLKIPFSRRYISFWF